MSKNSLKFQIVRPDGQVVACPRSALKPDGKAIDPAKLKAGWSIYAPAAKPAPVQAPAAQKGR